MKTLSLVFVNIWGLALCVSFEGFHHYVNFVEAKTNFINWVYLVQLKSQVGAIFEKFKIMFKAQSGYWIKSLQTYNTLEFKKITPTLEGHGIKHRLPCLYNHQ